MLRLAYLTGSYPAVSHTFILREVEALRDLGFEVLTCSIRRTPEAQCPGAAEKEASRTTFHVLEAAKRPSQLLRAQISALRHPGRYLGTLRLALRTGRPGLKGLLWQIFYFAEATVLARHLKLKGIDHLHNHFASSSASVAMLAAALADIDFSYTLHGPSELYDPFGWKLAEKTARARFVFCISHFARAQAMLHSHPVHWSKLKIIHCGVEPELYGHEGITTDRQGLHLAFVGRLAPVKGLRVLLEAFGAAREEVPGLHLTLVGDGEDRAHLEMLAAPHAEAVRFTGSLDQQSVAEILRETDAFVLPSFAEGVPVALMEAMASRKPVIATQVGGVSELIEHGVSGFIVAPGHQDGLRQAIVDLSDPGLRARMGQAGRAKVEADFDVRCEAARIAALLLGAGGDAPRPPALPRATAESMLRGEHDQDER